MPVRVSSPCRNITRRSVITKCVVHQFRNGHTVSQPTSISQTAAITSCTTFLAVASQSVRDDHRGDEGRQRGGDQQHQHRADQSLPMRMPVQHHLLVGGEHIVRIAHSVTLLLGSSGSGP